MTIELNKDIELASRLTSNFFNEPLGRIAPLIGKGSVNKVFIVETVNRRAVVRMSDRGEALDEYHKEAWCMERAAERGVIVPSVIGVGRYEGNAYIVESYIAGDEGRDIPAAKLRIWRELGRYAKLIHSIHVHGFGLKLSEIRQGDARKSWLRYLEYNIESLTEEDALIKLKVLTPQQSKVVRSVFADLKGREFTFGLNHGDISLKNTIVDVHGGVTLLDWGSAEASIVPHHDLIEMLKMSMLEGDPDDEAIMAFLESYGISPAGYEGMMRELEALLLLRAFDKLRWAIEWNPKELDSFVSHASDAVSRYLTQA